MEVIRPSYILEAKAVGLPAPPTLLRSNARCQGEAVPPPAGFAR